MSDLALQASVLVLNRSFAPIHVTTAQRAFCLLFKSVAQVVDVQDGSFDLYNFESWQEVSEFKLKSGLADERSDWVSTVRFEIEVPRIIRLLFCNRFERRPANFNRRNIYARDGSQCQYCGHRFPTSELSIDHVIPISRGGKSCWENVVCACTECNKKKGGRTPREAGMALVRKPFAPKCNPLIQLKLMREKYYSWKHFLDEAYWFVTLQE
jgi:hypothetical protein